VLLTGGVLFLARDLWEVKQGYQANMDQLTEQLMASWNSKLTSEATFMKEQLNDIKRDREIQKAWLDRDIATLITLAQPAFENMKRDARITHFNFIKPDRTCLLRMQKPKTLPMVIDRPSLIAAVQTGEDCWGIDIGLIGSLTFRFVTPWKQDGVTIGYLELGTESQSLVKEFAYDMNLDTAVVIKKRCITKEQFEGGRQDAGFAGQWNDYHDVAVIAKTIPRLPDEVIRRLEASHSPISKVDIYTARTGETEFVCGSIHVIDFAGRDVGDIIVMRDITTDIRALWSTLFLSLGMTAAAIFGILALIWSVTSMAERRLGTAFAQTQESEQRYRTLFASSMDALMPLEPPDWRFTSGNQATLRMFHASDIQQFTSTEPWTLSPEKQPDGTSSVDKAKKMIEAAMRDGSHFFSWTHRRLNGEAFSANVLLTRLERNGRMFLQATVRDVSVEETVLNNLRISEDKYRSIVETTDTGFMVLDGHGMVLDANQKYIRLTGYSELREIIGRSVIEWTAEGSKQRNAEAVAKCARDGLIRNFTTEYINRSGQITPIEINATVTGEGESLRIVSLCRDITLHKQAEDALKQRAAELELFNTLMIGREIRMVEMKKEINALLRAAGRKEKYVAVE
ncbi:MAG: PAS domain S-box protein, partial [bacterium]